MITIQLLDYNYGSRGQNQINLNNATSNTSATYPWQQLSSTEAKIVNQATGTKYLSPVSGLLTKGQEYKVSATVADYTGSGGSIGFSTGGTNGLTNGIPATARRSSNGSISEVFTATNFENVRIFSGNNGGGTLENISIVPISSVQWDYSVVGTLDVGSSQDFPLALTFSISEIRDIDARTGTYSKTFQIPATKNNNRVLKSVYHSGATFDTRVNSAGKTVPVNKIYLKKQCRIIIDGIYSLTGLFELTAVGKTSNPSYYSCVFYGNNVDWATSLNDKLLKDLSVPNGEAGSGWDNLNGRTGNSGIGLQVDEPSITASWCIDDAVNKTCTGGATAANDSPIVYPIVGYGEYNAGGDPYSIQLLRTKYEAIGGSATQIGYYGWNNSGDSYGTPVPTCDWRPAIFIYDIIHQMFSQEGYTVVSNFIETDMFKKLLMLLPNFKHSNPQERSDDNSIKGTFTEPSGLASIIFPTGTVVNTSSPIWKSYVIKFNGNGGTCTGNFVTTLNTGMYNDSTGYFTISEYGFYDVSLNNMSVWIESLCGTLSTTNQNKMHYFRIFVEVETAGQTSWERIGEGWGKESGTPAAFYGCPMPVYSDRPWNFENILIENHWFNKNDKIRFVVQYKMGIGSGTNKVVEWETYVYGGKNPGGPGPPCGVVSDSTGELKITHKGVNVEYGQTYDLKNVIDTQSKQLDFLKGVIHAFNLQLTTDAEAKTVTIEPFNDFYKPRGEAIDWTGKVDLSQNQEDKWYKSGLKKEVIFKYKTDPKDKKVEHRGITYWDGIIDEYPFRQILSSSLDEFEVGVSVFENPFFAGTYNSQDGQRSGLTTGSTVNTPVTANLWGLCPSGAEPTSGSGCRPPKENDFIPRLVHYNKMDCSVGFGCPGYYARVQVWAFIAPDFTLGNPWVVSGVNASYEYEILATANSYNKIHASTLGDPATHSPPYSGVPLPLTYGSTTQTSWDCTTCTFYGPSGYKGLYQQYYQNMIEMMITNPRLKMVYVNLKMSDIVDLDLSKLVYIDGYYYRINRIIDFQVNNNNPTKVELVLFEDLGGFAVDATFGS